MLNMIHYVALPARISLTSLATRLYRPLLPGGRQATPCINTELFYIGSSLLSNLCSPVWMGPQEYIAYKFVPTSSAVSCMSDSSNLDSLLDGW